jgi:single-strand DNA-binding protein
MASLNKVILMGNLVADPEFKTTPNGVAVTTIRIAVGRRYAKQGDEVTTDFFNVVCWRGLAEFVSKYFTKGKAIVVVGSLQNRSWTDQNGQKRISTEIVADECTFAGNAGAGGQQGDMGTFYGSEPQAGSVPAAQAKPAAATFEELSTEDDLPF